jgi:ketosteroid isomerase-like protein
VEFKEKLALIREWQRVILQRDLEAVLALCTDDVVLDYSESIGPMKDVYQGREGLEKFGSIMSDSFSKREVQVEETIDAPPDGLVMRTRLNVTGKGSGATATSRGGFLVRFRDDKIALMKIYQSLDDALAAAGVG